MYKKLAVITLLLIIACVLIYLFVHNKGSMTSETNTNNMQTSNPETTTTKTAGNGDTVSVNYTGALENGTVFDSNIDPNFHHVEPLYFTIGAGTMIKGFNDGVVGMKVGEEKKITIAPADAYGAAGRPGIPPNSTLVFTVTLLEIK